MRGVNRVPPAAFIAPSGNRTTAAETLPGTPETDTVCTRFGSSVRSCTSDFDRKKRLKSYFKITFCPAGMPAAEYEKGRELPRPGYQSSAPQLLQGHILPAFFVIFDNIPGGLSLRALPFLCPAPLRGFACCVRVCIDCPAVLNLPAVGML